MSSKIVSINRSISMLSIQTSRFGALPMIRRERENARALAKQQLRAQPRLAKTKASINHPWPILDLTFTFTDDLGQHHYKKVGRCEDCDRRWGEHSTWEKAR